MRLRCWSAAAIAVGTAFVVLAGVPASAQTSPCPPGGSASQYPPQACALAVGTTQVRPGEPLPVSGSGFAANSDVILELRSPAVSVGTARTDASGVFSTTVVIPPDTTPGTRTLAAMGRDPQGRPRELTSTVSVLGVEVSRGEGGAAVAGVVVGAGDSLPTTGSPSSAVSAAIAGVVLVGVGSLAVVAARRRKTTG